MMRRNQMLRKDLEDLNTSYVELIQVVEENIEPHILSEIQPIKSKETKSKRIPRGTKLSNLLRRKIPRFKW